MIKIMLILVVLAFSTGLNAQTIPRWRIADVVKYNYKKSLKD